MLREESEVRSAKKFNSDNINYSNTGERGWHLKKLT